MIREGEMQKTVGDYIMEYMALHQKQAQKEVRQNPRKKSQAATKLAETLRQSGLETVPVTPQSPMPRMMRRPIPNFLRGQPGVKNEE